MIKIYSREYKVQMIPINEPSIGAKELEYAAEAVKSGWISSEGKFIKLFEEKFAQNVQRKHGVAVNNGTNALILALRALNLPEGSEVIIPSFTIISCALACIYNNLIPVFVDADEETWNMDASRIEEKITRNTRAIMAVHIYGHPVDIDKIVELAKKHQLYIIEDFAEAIGSEYKNKKCGGFGDISCTSFYANKTITTGEGGMCLTDNDEIADKLKSLRNLAFIPEKRFVHEEPGFNFRLTNVQAAIGLAQAEKLEEHVEKKAWIGKKYSEYLKDLEIKGLLRLPAEKSWAKNTYWMYGIVLNKGTGICVIDLMKKLLEKGIQTRPFFYPMHLQPLFVKYPWFKKERLPVSENLSEYGCQLPSGLTLSEENIARVTECLKEIIA
jgi:perosamine synthetase